jgi:hypothetical protein
MVAYITNWRVTKKLICRLSLVLLLIIQITTLQTGLASALLPFTQNDLDKLYVGQNYRDPNIELRPARCGGSLSQINNRVFYIGDSLTVGMVTSGNLLQKTVDAGFSADIESDFIEGLNEPEGSRRIRVVGPSVEATGGYNIPSTITSLGTHESDFNSNNAGIIVVGLGTNLDSDPVTQTNELMDYLRSINPSAVVYWVNTYFIHRSIPDKYIEVNEAIAQVQSERGDFEIIDFASAAIDNDELALTSDGYHHTGAVYANKADFILSRINEGGGGGTSSCNRSSTGDYEKDAFLYLSEIYSKEIAAGMVANFRNESGVNPIKLECIYTRDYGVENFGLDPALLEGDGGGVRLANFNIVAEPMLATLRCPNESNPKTRVEQLGWGIVQWTPASKMIDPSRAKGYPDSLIEDLYFQLDFLIEQLNGVGEWAGSPDSRAGTSLRTATTPQEAAAIFAIEYERCGACKAGNEEVTQRGEEAFEIFTLYGSL